MNDIDITIEHLKNKLKQPLPGETAHTLLAPIFNGVNRRQNTSNHNTKRCAVLLLL